MTDIVKLYRKKPSLLIWTSFGIGIVLFMIGTVNPAIDPNVNAVTLIGEFFFALGIVIGAYLLVVRNKK